MDYYSDGKARIREEAFRKYNIVPEHIDYKAIDLTTDDFIVDYVDILTTASKKGDWEAPKPITIGFLSQSLKMYFEVTISLEQFEVINDIAKEKIKEYLKKKHGQLQE